MDSIKIKLLSYNLKDMSRAGAKNTKTGEMEGEVVKRWTGKAGQTS
jgi:hypothetical protein